MSSQALAINESFNARLQNIEDLCSGFIVNEYYARLAGSSHSIMIGPRGSGKTTLMKMLQVEALKNWDHVDSGYYRNSIKFSGVFVPTDRFWKTQYERIEERSEDLKGVKKYLNSVFVYHVLERLCATASIRVSRSVERDSAFRIVYLSKSDESELVKELAGLWCVSPSINSLKSLEISLSRKKNEISNYIVQSINGDNIKEIDEVVSGDVISILEPSTSILNTYFNQRGEKWAFLFDELELAPENIIQPLVDAMRGGPEDVIIKLSLSPYHKNVKITDSAESSMKDQDLSFINLSAPDEKSGLEFSKKLCSQVFCQNDLVSDFESYFEKPSAFDEYTNFRELSQKDESFNSYLCRQNIFLDDFNNYTEKNKRPTIRKIKFIVYLRNYYLKSLGKKKSRKVPADYYSGIDRICQAMEYNPRMLIGIMNKFVPIAKGRGFVSVSDQLRNLSRFSSTYKSLLNTIPVNSKFKDINSIFDLVDKVAGAFGDNVISREFNAEPKGTLIFAKVDDDDLLEAIGYALNAGAFIVEDEEDYVSCDVVDIKNSRVRLSYLFAHEYRYLMTQGRDVDLMDLLEQQILLPDKKENIQPKGNALKRQLGFFE